MELARRNNIVPHEDVQGAVSRNLHGCGRIDTRVDEVANGGPSEIMGNKAPVLIPRFSCLFSKSTMISTRAQARAQRKRANVSRQFRSFDGEFTSDVKEKREPFLAQCVMARCAPQKLVAVTEREESW